jgi:sugar phosphate isomerase/epimerase
MPSSPIRLLASTGSLLLSPLGWVMEAIAEAGFDGAELVVAHNAETRDPERVRELADATGLEVPVVHGPYMLLLRNVLGTGYVDKTRRSLELASALGASFMVAHAPFRFERKACRWLAEQTPGEFADYDARFAMENLFPVAGRSFSLAVTPDEMTSYEHVVFDTSHFAVAGIDLFTAWEALADRVVHLHISDNAGKGRDSHAPIGSGSLPLAAFMRHVAASGWTGSATLEIDVRAQLEDRDTLVRFLRGQVDLARRLFSAGSAEAPGAGDDRPRTSRPARAGIA